MDELDTRKCTNTRTPSDRKISYLSLDLGVVEGPFRYVVRRRALLDNPSI